MDKLKISTIVGNLVKADQAKVKLDSPINHGGPLNDDDIIVINVGGVRHETQISTLLKKPETRLYSVAEAAKAQGKREFYFDRNPQMFPSILNYYRIGKLHMPSDVCGPAAKAELDYWELEDKDIEQCCWVNYISYEETLEMLEKFEADERNKFYSVYVSPHASLLTKLKPRVWRAVQDPYSSKNALAYAVLSLTLVLLSIVVFVIETLPYFGSVFVQATKFNKNITSDDLRNEMKIFTDITPNDVLLLIDNACNIFFFIEFVIKLIASPDKRKFFKSPLVIIELLALVPYYIAIFVVLFHPDPKSVFMIIRVLFATRVLRIFRIFVLMKHFLALKILIFTIRASTKELFLLLIVLLIGVVIFACLEYYMEIFSDYDSHFTHIPLAFWWALITMTTVGYGDVYPQTGLGYAIGGFCAISGVLVIALSVPVIVNNFTVYYSHAQSREKLKMRKRKFEQTEKWQRLRAGLKNKLKNGTLKGLINSARKKYGSDSSNGGPALKFSLLKHRGGGGASSRGSRAATRIQIPEPASEIESDVPSTARDVVLEEFTTADELSDGGRAGISMISDSVELSSSRSPSNGSGSNLIPEDDGPGSRPGVKKKYGLSVVRSKFFANGVKPKIVTRRTKSTEIHPLKTVTPKRIVKR